MRDKYENLIQVALDKATSSRSSSAVKPTWVFDHLSNEEFERIRWFLKELQFTVAKSPIFDTGFQFLELFLSNPTFPNDILDRLGRNNLEPEQSKINFQLAVSVQLAKTKNGYSKTAGGSSTGFRTSHYQYRDISQHEERANNLEVTCNTYLFGNSRVTGLDRTIRYEYEFFRYFCIKTILSSIIYADNYDFESSGITAFLTRCSDSDRPDRLQSDVFVPLKNLLIGSDEKSKDLIAKIRQLFETDLNSRLPSMEILEEIENQISRQTVKAKQLAGAIEFMKTLISQADAVAMQTLRSRFKMPLQCYSMYFGVTMNDYPGWIGSFTGPSGFTSDISYVMPGQVLDRQLGQLEKSINYNSYRNYIEAFPRTRIDSKAPIRPQEKPNYRDEKPDKNNPQELGLMIVAPFSLDYDHFHKFGFVRAMRHFTKADDRLYYAEEGDTELSAHKAFMGELADHIKEEFEKHFRTEMFFSNGVRK